MPRALRSRTLEIAHQGHQGIVKTKQLLRSKVWWPGIDKDTEKLVGDCLACQATGPAVPPIPVQMSELPTSYGFLWPVSHRRNAVRGDRRVFQIP